MIREAINGEIVSDRHQISEEWSGDPGSEIQRLDLQTKAVWPEIREYILASRPGPLGRR